MKKQSILNVNQLFRISKLITLCLLLCQLTSGQNDLREFGKVGGDDINYSECPFDKSAEAVVLFDKAETYFSNTDEGFNVVFERVTRIKILKDGGAEYAKVEIPLYTSNNIDERIDDLAATAYNLENGEFKITKLSTQNCHTEKLSENWEVEKFAIPNVKAGTVIEYKYRITSGYVFNLRDWNFQWKIPVLYSEYVVKMIPFYEYTFLLQGANRFATQTSVEGNSENQFGSIKYHEMIHTYIMKDIPAFKDEEYITAADDYIIKLDFQLSKIYYTTGAKRDILTNWPQLKEDLIKDENFGSFQEKCQKAGEKLFNIEGMTSLTSQQKFDSVINYVKRNYTWNKSYRIYNSKKVSKLLTDKFGNSADLNLFAIGLLNKVGIPARPILISTRNNGKIKSNYPFLDGFNNVVIAAQLDSAFILSDATDILLDNKMLPIQCINDKGLLIDKNKKTIWINMQVKKQSTIKTVINAVVTEDAIKSHFEISADNYSGLDLCHDYGADKIKLLKNLNKQNYEISDSSLVINNITKASDIYSYKFNATFKPESLKNKLYISPFFNEVISDNPLKQKERSYPIDMIYSKQKIYESDFTIPDNYKISFIPANENIDCEKFVLNYKTETSKNHIHISLSYLFKQSEYPAAEYANLKTYFDEIISKAAEKIVLEKQ